MSGTICAGSCADDEIAPPSPPGPMSADPGPEEGPRRSGIAATAELAAERRSGRPARTVPPPVGSAVATAGVLSPPPPAAFFREASAAA